MPQLIAISGKKRHGKNAVADLVQEGLEYKGKTVVQRHFADAVKEECAEMLTFHSRAYVLKHLLTFSQNEQTAWGVYSDLFLKRPERGLWGRIKWVLGINRWRSYSPSCTLAKGTPKHHNPYGDYTETYQYLLDCMYGKQGEGMKERFRTWMQWYGTDYARDCIDKNYWRERLAKWVDDNAGEVDFVLIPDARFPNEVEFTKGRGGKVLRVERPTLAFLNEGTEASKHYSETALDDYTGFDWVIKNDKDLATLKRRVHRAMARLYYTPK